MFVGSDDVRTDRSGFYQAVRIVHLKIFIAAVFTIGDWVL